jgi:5-methyltetrahydrofolate--homocysteine methyltransferase
MQVAASDILRANVQNPRLVASIHESYIQAGAQYLTANTFGLPDGPDWQQNMYTGLRLVVEVANASEEMVDVWIPLMARLVIEERAFISDFSGEVYAADGIFLLETCTRLTEAVEAVRILRDLGYRFRIGATCHFQSEGTMPDGSTPEQVVTALQRAGADIVGANCGDGPEMFVPIAARMRQATDAPLLFQPNAGLPHQGQDGNQVYSISPEEFARSAYMLFDVGPTIVGGCCGTTPEHIEQLVLHTVASGRPTN